MIHFKYDTPVKILEEKHGVNLNTAYPDETAGEYLERIGMTPLADMLRERG